MIFSIAITGPTASGKTALSLALARELDAEIISCDSMQIYRGMDIGTAKATREEQSIAPHHLIDLISPEESYSVECYREAAIACAKDIAARGRLPMFVGGTGLYIDAVMRGSAVNSPESDPEYRESILASIKDEADVNALWERLRTVDPESADKIHRNNVKRVIRALEIYDKTGIPKSVHDKSTQVAASGISVGMITIDFHNRDTLYERVDRRVDMMMAEGLTEEVKRLYEAGYLTGDNTASQAIGYKELVSFLKAECTLSEAVERIKLSSRRYAKRQLTWFRHEKEAVRIFADDENGNIKSIDILTAEAADAVRTFSIKKGNTQ